MARILVTGSAGFVGFHLARRLCAAGEEVASLDSVNDYYDVVLKRARLKQLEGFVNHRFVEAALEDREAVDALFRDFKPEVVVNLAAQAGVRYSLQNPHAYVGSNIVGFLNILEACRHHGVGHLVFASSSSVYGANKTVPFSVHQNVDHPISLYAASKKSNELMAHTYAHLFGLPCTGLRFFTVYGPWGRPDMAVYLFTKSIFEGRPINVFNNGRMKRDFTYIDDIVEGIVRVARRPAASDASWRGEAPDPGSSAAPYRLYNIGNSSPVELTDMIAMLEDEIGLKAEKIMMPLQPGDIAETSADVADLEHDVGFRPSTPLQTGLKNFVAWYRDYYGLAAAPASRKA